MQKEVLKRFSHAKFILLILLGTISWSITMIKSGIMYPFGLGFWGANGHDAIWHLALSESLARGSLGMPVFAGSRLQNYHIGFDLLIAAVHRLTNISTVSLYFQVIPPILALLTGIVVYLFVKKIKNSQSALWAMFLVYFGGDLGWLVIFLREGKLGGESMFWSQQAVSSLINPPFALSLIFIFLGLIFFSKKKILLSIMFFGLLFEIKAYAGILVLGSLFLTGIYEYLKERKLNFLKVFLGSTLVSLVVFLFLNRESNNPFIFYPFWFLDNLFNSDRFNWNKFYSALTNYKLAHNWLKLIPSYIIAFAVFWVGNMWTRLFKEIEVLKWIRKPKQISPLDVFIASIIISGALIPMLFVQEGTPWNTIQFFYYSLVFSGILGGIGISTILNKRPKNTQLIITVIIVFLTIPTTVSTLANNYLPARPPAKLSFFEKQALDFLSGQNKGVVLTYPFDPEAAKKAEANPPRPLYLYDSTAYVSAFSDKDVFLEDEVNLNITGFDWRTRRAEVDKFLNTLNQKEARDFLKNNNISYVYWVKPQRANLGESQLGIYKIFENSEVNIYKVD